jgi:hypothetical protein
LNILERYLYGIGEEETLETEEEESLTTGECEEPPRKDSKIIKPLERTE